MSEWISVEDRLPGKDRDSVPVLTRDFETQELRQYNCDYRDYTKYGEGKHQWINIVGFNHVSVPIWKLLCIEYWLDVDIPQPPKDKPDSEVQ